jgi:hypothetical protein
MDARERRIALSVRKLAGMPFARDEQCPGSQWCFGEHPRPSTALAVHAAETPRTVARRATSRGDRALAGTYVTGLIVDAHLVFGAYGCDLKGGSRVAVRADKVLLAAISLAHTRHRCARDDRGLTQASRDPPLPPRPAARSSAHRCGSPAQVGPALDNDSASRRSLTPSQHPCARAGRRPTRRGAKVSNSAVEQ